MYVVIGLQDHEGSVGGDSADHEHLEERTLQDLPEELLTFHVLPPVRGASERCGYRRQLDSRSTAPLLGAVKRNIQRPCDTRSEQPVPTLHPDS